MKQINVCVGVKTSDCGKYCSKECKFKDLSTSIVIGWCGLFDKEIEQSKDFYLRCDDCIDHEE